MSDRGIDLADCGHDIVNVVARVFRIERDSGESVVEGLRFGTTLRAIAHRSAALAYERRPVGMDCKLLLDRGMERHERNGRRHRRRHVLGAHRAQELIALYWRRETEPDAGTEI